MTVEEVLRLGLGTGKARQGMRAVGVPGRAWADGVPWCSHMLGWGASIQVTRHTARPCTGASVLFAPALTRVGTDPEGTGGCSWAA